MRRTMVILLLLKAGLAAAAQNLPKVVVLATGGTIASKQDPVKGGYVPALSGEDLVAGVPAIKRIAQIQVELFSNISSQDTMSEIWIRLAQRVNELLARQQLHSLLEVGFLILSTCGAALRTVPKILKNGGLDW